MMKNYFIVWQDTFSLFEPKVHCMSIGCCCCCSHNIFAFKVVFFNPGLLLESRRWLCLMKNWQWDWDRFIKTFSYKLNSDFYRVVQFYIHIMEQIILVKICINMINKDIVESSFKWGLRDFQFCHDLIPVDIVCVPIPAYLNFII